MPHGEPVSTIQAPPLKSLLPGELSAMLSAAGFEPYRGRQVFHWLQAKGAASVEEMRNLPQGLRAWLAENTRLGGIARIVERRQSADGSTKYLYEYADGRKVEAVLMPDPKRGFHTMCVSSQVGCAVDCKFCLTGRGGFFRNLGADEIVDQVLVARRLLRGEKPDAVFRNIVFMGMGEPLLNTEAVVRAIRLLTHKDGADFSPRRITVSTSGIIPGLRELAGADTGVGLAISLNATTQEEREAIMPITKRYPLGELLEAARAFPLKPGRRITFEYVLLKGVNDSPDHARRIVRLLRGIPAKVNLIPFNANALLPFERPDRDEVEAFGRIIAEANHTVSIRWSKAQDVSGACGNLATEYRQRGGARLASPAGVPPAAPGEGHELDFFAEVATGDEEE